MDVTAHCWRSAFTPLPSQTPTSHLEHPEKNGCGHAAFCGSHKDLTSDWLSGKQEEKEPSIALQELRSHLQSCHEPQRRPELLHSAALAHHYHYHHSGDVEELCGHASVIHQLLGWDGEAPVMGTTSWLSDWPTHHCMVVVADSASQVLEMTLHPPSGGHCP